MRTWQKGEKRAEKQRRREIHGGGSRNARRARLKRNGGFTCRHRRAQAANASVPLQNKTTREAVKDAPEVLAKPVMKSPFRQAWEAIRGRR